MANGLVSFDRELLMGVGEGWGVEFGDAMDKVAEVDGFTTQAEGTAVGFGEVEGCGDDLGEAVEILDGAGDEVLRLVAVLEGQCDFETAAHRGDGALEVVSDRVSEGAELIH